MEAAQVKALAVELESTLGLVAELLAAIREDSGQCRCGRRVGDLVTRLERRSDLAELPAVLLRAHAEITEVLGGLRLTREAIEAHAMARIRDTRNKLSDVTSATESATLELINGLDRSLEEINRLERDGAPDRGLATLREQVSALYNHLQFQDITAQQLQGVTHSLLELETRVEGLAAMFGRGLERTAPEGAVPPAAPVSSASLPYNPEATMKRDLADQAMIDETFHGARNGHAHAPRRSAPPAGR
jgi:hypothetical protein